MEYTEVSIATTSAGIEPLTLRLNDLGITGFVIEDAADFAEFLEEVTPHWDYVEDSLMEKLKAESKVKIYLAGNGQGADQLAMVRDAMRELKASDTGDAWGTLEISLGTIREEDWANEWKRFFKPLPVGERFLIKPTWEQVDDAQGRRILEIDPGCAFGSGTHETTQLCISLEESAVREGDHVLDMGCGSGILSIAALLLGAGDVTAVDIDEAAVRTAAENLENNGFTAYQAWQGDVLNDAALAEKVGANGPYDVIAANIVADVLIAMAPMFKNWLKPGGRLILSGIIGKRAADVRSAMEKTGFEETDLRQKNDWVAVRLK